MNYTREQLYNLSIYEVRKIGQLEGVKSPTSLKKDELIDEIIAISSGEKERYIPTSKKGRPSKAFKELDFLRNFEIEKEENKTSFFDSSLSICSPNLEEQAIYKMATEPVGEMEGFVDIVSSGFGILREKLSLGDDFVFLTSSLIKENNIKRGDFIRVSVLKLGDGKKFADKIISGPKNTAELEFMNLSAIYPGKVLNFKNNGILNTLAPVGAGQRVLISCKDENLLEENMFKLFDQIDIKKFFIIFGAQPEEKEKYKNSKNIICIENEKDIPLTKLAVNILHREAETGADCVLFILGVEKINLEEKFTNLTKELTSAFKNTKEAGSVSLIVSTKDENNFAFRNAFNLIIDLNERLYLYGIKFPIDVQTISLSRKDGLLKESNIETIKKCKLALLNSEKQLIEELNKLQ